MKERFVAAALAVFSDSDSVLKLEMAEAMSLCLRNMAAWFTSSSPARLP
jgi:hypothetical protein